MVFVRKAFSVTMLALLLASMLTLAFKVQPIETSETICSQADGMINTQTALAKHELGMLSEAPPTEWNKTYGGTGWDEVFHGLVQTSDGGYALVGSTNSSGAGGDDFWLVKTDASGNMQWNKTYGGTSWDDAWGVVQTVDGGYALAGVTLSFGFGAGHGDFWLVKTDASGNAQWNKTYGGTGRDGAYGGLVQTADGGYALAGYTYSFGAGSYDFWLVKTDASGNMQWNKTYGGTSWDDAWALVQTSDGGYALAGETSSFGAGNQDSWLVKTDASGNMQWNRTYGGTAYDWAYALVQTADGGYALAGYTTSFGAGNEDFWLVKTDAYGNAEWNKTYGGTNYDYAYALVQTGDGGYALTGETDSFGAGSYDFWLVKTDASGNMQWNKTYGGTNWDCALALVQTGDGGYALAGYTQSFGAGLTDFWLVKVGPSAPVGGDLTVVQIEPIQVIRDAQALIANKSSAVLVTVRSTFQTRVWAEINITYNFGNNWHLETGPYGNGTPIDPGLNKVYVPGGPFINETGVIQQPVPKFLTLPFKDDSVQLQKSWKAHVDDGTYGIDYIKGTLDEKTTWQSFPVVAAADGWAMRSVAPKRKDASGNWVNNYGNFVLIRHLEKDQTGNEYFTLYAQLNSVAPEIRYQERYSIDYNYDDSSKWTFVKRGEILGESGETGAEGTGIHLHFEMQTKGYCIIPYEEYRTNPYDIVGGRSYYPGYEDYEGCGSNHVWTTGPPQLPPLWLEWTQTGFDDRIAARVDPSNKIVETDETNNEKVCGMKVAESGNLRLLCVPIYFPALSQEPFNPQMQQEARFIQETYPVAEDKFVWAQTRSLAWPGSPPVPSDPEDEIQQETLREWLYRYVAVPVSFMTFLLGYDRAVIVLHDMGQSWGGIAIGMLESPENRFPVLVTEFNGRVREGVAAHEIGHTYCLWHPHDLGPLVFEAQRFCVGNRDYEDLASTLMSYRAAPLWIDKGRFDSNPKTWMAPGYYDFPGDPYAVPDPVLPQQDVYFPVGTYSWNLLDQFKLGIDPPIVALSGIIFSNNTAVADEPWYYVPEGFSDLASGSSGDYSIVLLDGSDLILDQFGFNASFSYLQDVDGTLRTFETDAVPFMLRVPYVEGTRIIEIRNATGQVLLSREASLNAPVVNVTSPNGGEVLRAGTNCTISWESSDMDGGNLTHFVEYSCDGGENWLPIALDVTGDSFVWDTSGLTRGSSYLVKILASDGVNTCVDSSNSTFSLWIPDVAVTDVTSSRTVIGQGYSANISTIVANRGDFTEAFNVTFHANTTAIASQTLTLTSGTSTAINFTWNTTGFTRGNYTIWAYAWPVQGETNTGDNNFTGGWVIVAMVGDITGPDGYPDGKVDVRDVATVARLFGVNYPDPRYNPNCDINDDLKIDVRDVATVARHFGDHYP